MQLKEEDVVLHRNLTLAQLQALYDKKGFNTRVILQTPRDNPVAAKSIGFPFNFTDFPELMTWNHSKNSLVLRLHVDIIRWDGGVLASNPHVEPDPRFHKIEHIQCALRAGETRGKPAVAILRRFLNS